MSEAERGNPGSTKLLADVIEWIKAVKALGGEPYVSFEDECTYDAETKKLTEWDDPRELSKEEEEHDDYPCSTVPTKAQYKAAVEKFLHPKTAYAELAEVRNFTAMNEPNNFEALKYGSPIKETPKIPPSTNARRAGEYWRALHDLCNRNTRSGKTAGMPRGRGRLPRRRHARRPAQEA